MMSHCRHAMPVDFLSGFFFTPFSSRLLAFQPMIFAAILITPPADFAIYCRDSFRDAVIISRRRRALLPMMPLALISLAPAFIDGLRWPFLF